MTKIKIDSGAAFLYPMPMVLVGSIVEGGDGPQRLDHLRGELSYCQKFKKSKTGIRRPERTDGVNRNKPHPVFCRQGLNAPCRDYSH